MYRFIRLFYSHMIDGWPKMSLHLLPQLTVKIDNLSSSSVERYSILNGSMAHIRNPKQRQNERNRFLLWYFSLAHGYWKQHFIYYSWPRTPPSCFSVKFIRPSEVKTEDEMFMQRKIKCEQRYDNNKKKNSEKIREKLLSICMVSYSRQFNLSFHCRQRHRWHTRC